MPYGSAGVVAPGTYVIQPQPMYLDIPDGTIISRVEVTYDVTYSAEGATNPALRVDL